jgi:acyl-CoA thioester hydrolase
MWNIKVMPRFGDMDILGHVNNTVPVQWFELARNPLFKIFDPKLKIDRTEWPLIMAHTDYDYLEPMAFAEAEIKTWVAKIGNKSFTLHHEAWQGGKKCVSGDAVVVYYDFNVGKSVPLPDEKKKLLEAHKQPTEK